MRHIVAVPCAGWAWGLDQGAGEPAATAAELGSEQLDEANSGTV